MGQRLTRLSLSDQTRTSAGGSQTGGNPVGAVGWSPARPWAMICVLAR
jgi:hypothetical protein